MKGIICVTLTQDEQIEINLGGSDLTLKVMMVELMETIAKHRKL